MVSKGINQPGDNGMLTKNHDQLTIEVKKHIESDMVTQGTYWDGSRGCFIGCLAHSSDVSVLGDRFGLPEPLVRICEIIFETLTPDDAKAFFAVIPDAVGCDGKDLTRVHWAFMASELQALPNVSDEIQAVIDPVIEGMLLLCSGQEWPNAAKHADAAALAAYTSRVSTAHTPEPAAHAAYTLGGFAAHAAYTAAACVSFDAASDADRAAHAAADTSAAARIAHCVALATSSATRIRQRDTILRLIEQSQVTT